MSQGDGFFFDPGEISGERLALAKEDLLARLTKLMQSCEGRESVAGAELTRPDPPDPAGRHWSASVVLAPAGGAPGAQYPPQPPRGFHGPPGRDP